MTKIHEKITEYEKEAREYLHMRNEAQEAANHFDRQYWNARKMIDGLRAQVNLWATGKR